MKSFFLFVFLPHWTPKSCSAHAFIKWLHAWPIPLPPYLSPPSSCQQAFNATTSLLFYKTRYNMHWKQKFQTSESCVRLSLSCFAKNSLPSCALPAHRWLARLHYVQAIRHPITATKYVSNTFIGLVFCTNTASVPRLYNLDSLKKVQLGPASKFHVFTQKIGPSPGLTCLPRACSFSICKLVSHNPHNSFKRK